MHTDTCGNTRGQKCHAKGSRKETKMQEFVYRDTTNVEHEVYDYTVIGASRIVKSFKEKCRSHTRKTVNRFNTKYKLY
jgi:transposase-like protein